ncbi:MAG: diacylglycerol kinase [Deltaproteobacteria bacterium]|nr:diacylglycerol kinase [Deltaproteobacteria bacterium]
MAGIGIVSNPRAHRNRQHPEAAAHLERLLGEAGLLRRAETPEELAQALAEMRRAGVDLLAVNGGDGTLHRVVTAVEREWGSRPWPHLLPLRGGAMNTVATCHGHRAAPEVALERVLARRAARQPLLAVERDLLRVSAEGSERKLGFLFGTGIAVSFLEAWYATGHATAGRALLLLLRTALSAAVGGRFAAAMTRLEPLRVAADGDEWPADAYLSVVAGAVPQIGFGFAPLGRCGEQPGFFHAVGVTGSATHLALRMPAVYLGRPWRRPLAVDAVARSLLVEGREVRYTLDGDLFVAPGGLEVAAGPLAEVVLSG